MRREILTSVLAVVVFTVLLGVLYPFAVTGVSQLAFPGNADGQLVYLHGRLVGSRLIGQQFATTGAVEVAGVPLTRADRRYFQSRPSATKPAYNASESTFSNLGPNARTTEAAIVQHVKAYVELERPYVPALTTARVPVDAATASASGLDPQISQANARIQAHRVAAVRRLPLATVDGLIARYTAARGLGFSGEPAVNVLELNLALDRLAGGPG